MLDTILLSAGLDDQDKALALSGGMAGGGLLGGALGFHALKPLNLLENMQAEKDAIRSYKDFQEGTEAISILNQINKGKLGWDEVPEELKNTLKATLEQNKEFFNDAEAVGQRLKERGPASVVHLPHPPKSLLQNVLPNRQMYAEMGEHIQNPIVKKTALAGAIGGGLLAKMLYDNHQEKLLAEQQKEDELKRQEEIKNAVNDFLRSRKQGMLDI